jgi:SAM-dependent methyltransferase
LLTWAAEPAVRRRLNRRVSGAEHTWPIEWLAATVLTAPVHRALSLGCGEGALERDLTRKRLCRQIVGLDLSPTALDLARERAREAGIDTIEYRQADLDRLVLPPGEHAAVFAHQALHHVRELESCLDQVAGTLQPRGLLYLDEYVGPSRHQWRRDRLAAADSIYAELPRSVRRRPRLQLPVDRRDPSEAVRSADIVPAVEARFAIRERRDYGGNLLSVIYPHLRLDALSDKQRDELLEHLLDREDALLAAGAPSYYTIIVATTRRE